MKTTELKNTIDKLENLIRLQGIELDNTRNLLGRCLDNFEGNAITVKSKRFDVKDDICFDTSDGSLFDGFITVRAKKLPDGMTSIMQQITKLREELGA
jgi:hypothetical protein